MGARTKRLYRAEIVAACVTTGYSALLNGVVPEVAHVPANLAAAGTSLLAARSAGVSVDGLGLDPARIVPGVRAGAAVALPAAATLAVALAVPATRRLLVDERVANVDRPAYELAVRIPIGTALCEELIFRGALLGLFGRGRSPAVAVAASSIVFGLWHVLPTLASTERDGWRTSAGAVAVAVGATAAAGCALAVLRLRARSLAAPVVVHAVINASVFGAVRLAGRTRAPATLPVR